MSTNTETKKNEWRDRELGALWMNKGQNKDYMSGHCSINDEKVDLVVFKNANKTSDRAPDYVIYKSRPKKDAAPTPENSVDEVPELLV
jgi:hypothetical protein